MNKRGFTLVELLVTIAIIAILGGVGLISYNSLFNVGKNRYYKALENDVLLAANDYFLDNRDLLDRPVNITDLVAKKYIETVKNQKGEACGGKVVPYKEGKTYLYEVCLECGDYESNGKYCQGVSKITATGKTSKNKAAYDVNKSFDNADYISGENVIVTFDTSNASVVEYIITNTNTGATLTCNDFSLGGNKCAKEITSTGTYNVIAYGEGNKVLVNDKYINVKILDEDLHFDITGIKDEPYKITQTECNGGTTATDVSFKIVKDVSGINEEYKSVEYKFDRNGEEGTYTSMDSLLKTVQLASGEYVLSVRITNFADERIVKVYPKAIKIVYEVNYEYEDDNTTGVHLVIQGKSYDYVEPLATTKTSHNVENVPIRWYRNLTRIYGTTIVEDSCTHSITGKTVTPVDIPSDFSNYCLNPEYSGEEQVITKAAPSHVVFTNNRYTNVKTDGLYTIRAELTSDEYMWSDGTTYKTFECNIAPKEITVTADDKSMYYGGTAPTYTSTTTGVIGNENVISGTVGYTIKNGNTTVNNVSTAATGNYSIVPSGLTAGSNYTIRYVNGTLTISDQTYTIHYRQGTATSSSAAEEIGTQTCTWGKTCTIVTYASLTGNSLGAGVFPYSASDTTHNVNARWQFSGWALSTRSDYESRTERDYVGGNTFSPSSYSTDYYLYAVGVRGFGFSSGIAPTTRTVNNQYWNPCRTTNTSGATYLTAIDVPSATNLSSSANGSWTFIGYYNGTDGGTNTTVTIDSSYQGSTYTMAYNVTSGAMVSKYSRTLTVSYNPTSNGSVASGKTDFQPQTLTQVYNSGYGQSDGTNSGDSLGAHSITLVNSSNANNTYVRTGYSVTAWLEGSTSGTALTLGSSYTSLGSTITSTNLSKTMYAQWTIQQYSTTFNYRESRTYTDTGYLNTGYKVNFDRDFRVVVTFLRPTADVRNSIISNYNDSGMNLDISVTAANKLRLYMGSGGVNKLSTVDIPTGQAVQIIFDWTASTHHYSLTATSNGMTDISISGTRSDLTGTATQTLRTNVDYSRTSSHIRITQLYIRDYRNYNTSLSDLPSFGFSGWTRKGWFTETSGGTQITTSTKVPTEAKTYYAQWKTWTKNTQTCRTATWNSGTSTMVPNGECTEISKSYANNTLANYYRTCGSATVCYDGSNTSGDNYYICVEKTVYTRTGCSAWNTATTETGQKTCSATTDNKYKITCTEE